ncbi:MAG: nuclear transport factor 2 family protein [Chloroflexota bacterium]
MPERTGRAYAEAYQIMLRDRAFDRLPELLHPDCVHEYPQSGERVVGIDNIRGIFETYPGGVGIQEVETLRVAGEDRDWAMAPNFTLVRLTGAGNSYTSAVRAQYPDGNAWYVVSMFELVDGLMTRATIFFAPLFEPPQWRRQFTDAASARP